MIKNLNISGLSKNIKKGIKYKIIATGLVGVIATSSLTGCVKKNPYVYNNLNNAVLGLSDDAGLTSVDEVIGQGFIDKDGSDINFSGMDELFIDAYNFSDSNTCNECIRLLGNMVIRSLISEAFPRCNIDNFKVDGWNYTAINNNGTKADYEKYCVYFNDSGYEYVIVADDKMSEDICSIVEAASNNQLELNSSDEGDKYIIANAYNYLIDVLKRDVKLVYDDYMSVDSGNAKKIIVCKFKLEKNRAKEKAIKKGIKDGKKNNKN